MRFIMYCDRHEGARTETEDLVIPRVGPCSIHIQYVCGGFTGQDVIGEYSLSTQISAPKLDNLRFRRGFSD